MSIIVIPRKHYCAPSSNCVWFHLITSQPPTPALDRYKYCEWVLIGYQFWNQTGTYNIIMGEQDYTDHSFVISRRCACYALFAYNTKREEFEPLVIRCCGGEDSMAKTNFESIIIPLLKNILERERLQRQSSTQRTAGWRGVATNFVLWLLFEI